MRAQATGPVNPVETTQTAGMVRRMTCLQWGAEWHAQRDATASIYAPDIVWLNDEAMRGKV